jgi:CHAT domain-containing protein
VPVPGRAARLIDCCNVAYLPTAALLAGAPHPQRIWPFWRDTLLGFANPARGQGTDALNLPGAPGTAPLPGAQQELHDVSREIGGRASLHSGADARKEYLAHMGVSHPPVLHLATHAMSDSEDPARSYILFAPARSTDAFDYMFLKEVGALDLHQADLVTLSACDSAQGEMVDGEGVQSFSSAFLNAGAKSVVASLWPVSDQATARLMHDFYAQLANGTTASEALRAAKLDAIARGDSQPFYWAGFTLTGDGGMRIPRIIPAWMFAAGALAIAGLALVAIGLSKRARSARRSMRTRQP